MTMIEATPKLSRRRLVAGLGLGGATAVVGGVFGFGNEAANAATPSSVTPSSTTSNNVDLTETVPQTGPTYIHPHPYYGTFPIVISESVISLDPSMVSANTPGTANNPVTVANAPRPAGLTVVNWSCATQPVNMAIGDIWDDTGA